MKAKFECNDKMISNQILIAVEIFKIMNQDDIDVNVNVKYHQGKNAENGELYVDAFKISLSSGYDIYITGDKDSYKNEDEGKLTAEFVHNKNIEINPKTREINMKIKTILNKFKCNF
jgi:hypothetical protein